jgi:hypothetical protein
MRKLNAAQTLARHIAVSSINTNARLNTLGIFKTSLAMRARVCCIDISATWLGSVEIKRFLPLDLNANSKHQ